MSNGHKKNKQTRSTTTKYPTQKRVGKCTPTVHSEWIVMLKLHRLWRIGKKVCQIQNGVLLLAAKASVSLPGRTARSERLRRPHKATLLAPQAQAAMAILHKAVVRAVVKEEVKVVVKLVVKAVVKLPSKLSSKTPTRTPPHQQKHPLTPTPLLTTTTNQRPYPHHQHRRPRLYPQVIPLRKLVPLGVVPLRMVLLRIVLLREITVPPQEKITRTMMKPVLRIRLRLTSLR